MDHNPTMTIVWRVHQHMYTIQMPWELLLSSVDIPVDDPVHRVSEVLHWESTLLKCLTESIPSISTKCEADFGIKGFYGKWDDPHQTTAPPAAKRFLMTLTHHRGRRLHAT